MDDYVRLLFNPGSEPLMVDVPGNSYDVEGNLLVSGLSIDPYSSLIIMNSDKVYTGLRESKETELLLYPNPASDILYFRSQGMRSKYITVVDLTGRVVLREYGGPELENVNISSLQQGLYFLQLYDGVGCVTARFIKN